MIHFSITNIPLDKYPLHHHYLACHDYTTRLNWKQNVHHAPNIQMCYMGDNIVRYWVITVSSKPQFKATQSFLSSPNGPHCSQSRKMCLNKIVFKYVRSRMVQTANKSQDY